MSRILREHDLGVVTSDFTVAATVEALDALTPEHIERYKANAEAASAQLSAQTQVEVWLREVRGLFQREIGANE